MARPRPRSDAAQVNFTLDEHWRLALRLTAETDGVSVPELLRPLVIRYLKGRLRDPDLAEAVARIEKSRKARRQVPDNVAAISAPGAKRRPTRGRRSVGNSQPEGSDGFPP